jgi:hypothetical protein
MWPNQPITWRHYLVGVAAAEPSQPAAISVVEQVITQSPYNGVEALRLEQTHLEQVPGGSSLRDVTERVGRIYDMLKDKDESCWEPALLVDTSVLGPILPELLAPRRCTIILVTSGNEQSTTDRGVTMVPRNELAGRLLSAVQDGRFRTAETLELAPRFAKALSTFRYRPPAKAEDELETMRRQADDDLVIAPALCVWKAAQGAPTRKDLASTRPKSFDPFKEYAS